MLLVAHVVCCEISLVELLHTVELFLGHCPYIPTDLVISKFAMIRLMTDFFHLLRKPCCMYTGSLAQTYTSATLEVSTRLQSLIS